jgi:hypothetical protein
MEKRFYRQGYRRRAAPAIKKQRPVWTPQRPVNFAESTGDY